jgi:hypothetical protein
MARRARAVAPDVTDAATGIRAQARAAGAEAFQKLLRLSHKAKSESVQLAAIKELLDRGFGRAAAAPSENAAGVITHLLVDDGYGN